MELRPAFDALFAIDDAMAEVVARSTQPALAAIKLAWWRERLEELDLGKVPAEPRLQAAADQLLPRGIAGSELAKLEEGWAALLEETPDATRVKERGALLFSLGARLLGIEFEDTIAEAGRVFAVADAARRRLWNAVPFSIGWGAIPRRARPLTALTALAARDLRRGGLPFEPEATPGRAWTLLRHRLTGRFPRVLTRTGSLRT